MLKKALFYLGLGSDEEYERYDDHLTGTALPPSDESLRSAPAATPHDMRRATGSATVRPINPVEPADTTMGRVAQVDPTSANRGAQRAPVTHRQGASAVRIVDDPPTKPSTATPHTTSPTIFEEAPRIGERLKARQPVIVNLQNAEKGVRRRLLDFTSGACYALGGKMERVADQVFLITPPEANDGDHMATDASSSDELLES